ncbi:MAG: hypothetical protein KC777_02455 [Cyanobacteria bacterium HKST-UBA02]|nr:hypothetical protein [Cyanobacteria bacterium HKST-UBA02]
MYRVVPGQTCHPEGILQQSLDTTIALAIELALGDRLAATVSRRFQQASLVDQHRLKVEVPVRVAAIIGSLPEKIYKVIASSRIWKGKHLIPIMDLYEYEYPCSWPPAPFVLTPELYDPDNLRLAGRAVFELLDRAGLKPRIMYTVDWKSNRGWLAIAAEIETPAAPEPENQD